MVDSDGRETGDVRRVTAANLKARNSTSVGEGLPAVDRSIVGRKVSNNILRNNSSSNSSSGSNKSHAGWDISVPSLVVDLWTMVAPSDGEGALRVRKRKVPYSFFVSQMEQQSSKSKPMASSLVGAEMESMRVC